MTLSFSKEISSGSFGAVFQVLWLAGALVLPGPPFRPLHRAREAVKRIPAAQLTLACGGETPNFASPTGDREMKVLGAVTTPTSSACWAAPRGPGRTSVCLSSLTLDEGPPRRRCVWGTSCSRPETWG